MADPALRRPIRVLVVDDSAFMRHAVARLLGEQADIEVVGNAPDGEAGQRQAAALRPDVVTLDVEMPILDGLGMLRRLMVEAPARTIMLSSLTSEGAAVTLDALDGGAIDFVAKPSGSLSIDIGRVGEELLLKVRTAAAMSEAAFLAHRQRAVARSGARPSVTPNPVMAGTPISRPSSSPASAVPRVACRRLVAIASSTGGPAALQAVISGLPAKLGCGVVIVQHMPAGFTASLAARLASCGPLPATEAAAGDIVAEDRILVAPGGQHLIVSSAGRAQLIGLPPVNGVRPAADVTLQSLAPIWRERLLTVVLTGMGSDGREGARTVKSHGGRVFVQNEATSTVYGMPAAVREAGLADRELPLGQIARAIAEWATSAASDRASA